MKNKYDIIKKNKIQYNNEIAAIRCEVNKFERAIFGYKHFNMQKALDDYKGISLDTTEDT